MTSLQDFTLEQLNVLGSIINDAGIEAAKDRDELPGHLVNGGGVSSVTRQAIYLAERGILSPVEEWKTEYIL